MTRRAAVLFFASMIGCANVSPEAPGETSSALDVQCLDSARFELHGVGGANFNTLSVDTAILPMADVGKVLADDQIHMLRMAQNAGLHVLNKHVPAFVIFDGMGNVTSVESGGFYQCATEADCQGYLDQVIPNYVEDGVAFADRPEFHHSFQTHAYQVIGGAKFRDITDDYAIKITRWHVRQPKWNPRDLLALQWALHTRREACSRGLAQAFLLWSEKEQVVAEVTIGTKVTPAQGDPTPYFVETLGALASQDVLDPIFDQLPLDRVPPPVTDTYLVLTYWSGVYDPSRWPNSASTTPGGPLPEPYCGDGSCNQTVTDNENAQTCPVDCAPTCGNHVCDGGENGDTCAADCGQ